MSSLREALPPPPPKDAIRLHQVHVNLNDEHRGMLDDLAEEHGLMNTQVIRALIIQEHTNTFE